MRKTFRVITTDKYSFLNFGKDSEPQFKQLEFIGKKLFAGKAPADLATDSVRDTITQSDIFNTKELQEKTYQNLRFVISCINKRCNELHYEIYQTAHGEILMYFIAGKSLVNLDDANTFMADYMIFPNANSAESTAEDESFKDYPQAAYIMNIDYIQGLKNAIAQVA